MRRGKFLLGFFNLFKLTYHVRVQKFYGVDAIKVLPIIHMKRCCWVTPAHDARSYENFEIQLSLLFQNLNVYQIVMSIDNPKEKCFPDFWTRFWRNPHIYLNFSRYRLPNLSLCVESTSKLGLQSSFLGADCELCDRSRPRPDGVSPLLSSAPTSISMQKMSSPGAFNEVYPPFILHFL